MAAAFRLRGHPVDQNISYDANAPARPARAVLPASLHHGEPSHAMSAAYADARLPTVNDAARDMDYSPKQTPADDAPLPLSSPVQQHDGPAPSNSTPSVQHAPARPPPPPPPLLPNTAPAGQFDMLPPPASTHPSWQALHDYAQTHAAAHGYALSINTTAKNRSRIKLACVCYGQPKNTHKLTAETRVRKNRVSYKTGCRMWVEGKRGESGGWVLRVGEAAHNHAGRPSEGWAVQRKRTWGVLGGRIGVGGVTAKEEEEARRVEESRVGAAEEGEGGEEEEGAGGEGESAEAAPQQQQQPPRRASHSLESGGIVWKIVEQEMLRKGADVNQGRDRGVGRTVDVLQARLPGIRIFKRDVYNIRAQIKRARKAAGQQVGDGLASDHEHEDGEADGEADVDAGADEDDDVCIDESHAEPTNTAQHQQHQEQPVGRRWPLPTPAAPPATQHQTHSSPPHPHPHPHPTPPRHHPRPPSPSPPQIDPSLTTLTHNHSHPHPHPIHPSPSPPRRASMHAQWEQREVARLHAENAELRRLLSERTAELKERSIEVASLRAQVEYWVVTGR